MISKLTKNHPLFLNDLSSSEIKYEVYNLHTINKSDSQIAHFVKQPFFFFLLCLKAIYFGSLSNLYLKTETYEIAECGL